MKIELPHINYTIEVRRFKQHDQLPAAQAWVERKSKNHAILFLKKNVKPPTIAHELVHVLRYICEDRYMSFNLEEEHMAYIMQYALGRILGYGYVK